MQRAFVESMKTIAQTAIEKAGFDKTRNGKIVGVNSITNTYSVRVDGIIYNNVKVVNDMTCNVGDTVKVNIPMNNPSQAYITSSILSDESIGQKIAQATTAIDDINNQIESIAEIANSIYQLSVDVSYANDGNYKNVTYTAMLMQDGVNVTEDHEASEFRWYLEKTTGTEELSGSPAWAVVLSTRDYFYGQSILLEWTYVYTDVISGEQKTAQLRSRVTLISNDAIQQVAKYTTEVTNGGVFVHRADGNYDVGADWESVWAYGVKIANTVDIIKGGKIYGSFGGDYLTVGNTSENNIYMDKSGFIQLRQGSTVLTDIRPGSLLLGRNASSYYNVYMDTSNLYFRQGTTVLTQINNSSITLGKTSGYNTYITSSAVNLRYGTTNLAQFNSSGMTLKNSSGYDLMSLSSSGLYLYNGSGTNTAYFGTNGVTLRNSSGYTTFTAGQNAINLYTGTQSNVALLSVGTSGMTLKNSSGYNLLSLSSSGLNLYNGSGTQTVKFYSTGFWCNQGDFEVYVSGTHTYMFITGANNNTNFVLDNNADTDSVSIKSQFGGLYLGGYGGVISLESSASRVYLSTDTVAFRPDGNKTHNLGTSSHRWNTVYCHSTNTDSDRKIKNVTGDIDYAYEFIMNLKPVEYFYKDAKNNRLHMGFIAQDVAKIGKKLNKDLSIYAAEYITNNDKDSGAEYHGEIVDDKLLSWGLQYTEFIAPLIQVVQDQQKTIEDLNDRLSQLEQKE